MLFTLMLYIALCRKLLAIYIISPMTRLCFRDLTCALKVLLLSFALSETRISNSAMKNRNFHPVQIKIYLGCYLI